MNGGDEDGDSRWQTADDRGTTGIGDDRNTTMSPPPTTSLRHHVTTHNAPMAPCHVMNRGQGPNNDNESFRPVCKFCLFFFISYFY